MDSTSVATNYSFETLNKRAEKAARLDLLLENIGLAIEKRGLSAKDIQVLDPRLSLKQISHIRQGIRSIASVERLERLLSAIELTTETYDPSEIAA